MLIGIVGKPSAGKSTFFKAITLADVERASYPFTTIKPNEGVGFVKIECVDKEFNTQCNPREGYCENHQRFVPIKLLDVAGLVPGAHEGKGLGLQFLDDLRTADVLVHIIDASGSTNEKGETVEKGSHDPGKDIRFLEYEIDMWMFGILKKGWERFARQMKQEKAKVSAAIAKQLSGLNVTEDHVKAAMQRKSLAEDPTDWTDESLMSITREVRKMTKPILIAANKMDVLGAQETIQRLQQEFADHLIVPCSAECELALKEAAKNNLVDYTPGAKSFTITGNLNDAQKKGLEFMKTHVMDIYHTTGVQDVLDKAVFDLLDCIAVFPGGTKKLEDQYGRVLPDCFLLRRGTTALDFAYKLHTDLGKGFIRAIDVKTRQTIGKAHVLKHRDVIEIVSAK